jgi:hypothetical protein
MTDTVQVQDSAPVCPHGEQEASCKKCKDAARKRKQRSHEKERQEQAAAEKAQLSMTTQEWWNFNRAKLTEAQNAELGKRQESVLDTVFWMQAWIDGTYDVDPNDANFYVGLEEGTADIEADIRKFDTTYGYEAQQQLVERIRETAEFRQYVKTLGRPIFNGENATEIWLRYNYLVAIPSQLACDFRMKTQHPVPAVKSYTKMICTTRDCPNRLLPDVLPTEIADGYAAQGKPYLCHRCRDVEQKSRAQATISVEYRRPAGPKDIYDSWGRVKDQP